MPTHAGASKRTVSADGCNGLCCARNVFRDLSFFYLSNLVIISIVVLEGFSSVRAVAVTHFL